MSLDGIVWGDFSKTKRAGIQEGFIPCDFWNVRVCGKVLVTARGPGGGKSKNKDYSWNRPSFPPEGRARDLPYCANLSPTHTYPRENLI